MESGQQWVFWSSIGSVYAWPYIRMKAIISLSLAVLCRTGYLIIWAGISMLLQALNTAFMFVAGMSSHSLAIVTQAIYLNSNQVTIMLAKEKQPLLLLSSTSSITIVLRGPQHRK